ncbi:palmitoyltransferase ZDHHC11 isoform X2 [Hippocampus comes]|uniref:palmitoyltransferase ZDHHC11 isoform X2 n=1 Tax=Hippocampus comes TaxID=109280 RepID=UPI00094E9BEF|nr:PREDICTED: probable palmitoyltransferase ZDHHC11 isoform X2 [Hippocampus comes]
MNTATKMNVLNGKLRRTAPMQGSSRNELVSSKTPRVNGWTWPPQVFQVIAWLLYNYLAVVAFGMFIPLLPLPWNHVLYTFTGLAFLVHLLSHVAAVTIDPADASVRAKKTYTGPMPLFDRTVQLHVIQDLHCYLCEVKVGPKVKHCSICNKCVSDFDHHCKWLNNCVGGRNYRYFFAAVTSAAVGAGLLVTVILFVFIQHYLDPNVLRSNPQFHSKSSHDWIEATNGLFVQIISSFKRVCMYVHLSAGLLANDTWLVFLPSAPVKTSSAGLLIVAFVSAMLSLTCLLLLWHLLCFHFYLLCKGLSTYEYIKLQRQKEAKSGDTEVGNSQDPPIKNKVPQVTIPKTPLNSMDCEATQIHGASTRKLDDKGPLSNRLSETMYTEMENTKKQSTMKNSFHQETQNSAEKEPEREMSTSRSWKADAGDDLQSESIKSVESVPEVQDPLGSLVMTPDDT